MPEEDLRQARLDKLAAIKEKGLDPYGQRFDGAEPVSELLEKFKEDEEVPAVAAGRVATVRDHKKSMFLDLFDRTGRIQVYISKGDENLAGLAECLDLGDIVGVKGVLFKTRTGEVTLKTSELTFLSKNLLPPPEKYHGQTDVEQRYRMRYVDIATNRESFEVFEKRIRIIEEVRRFLSDRKYYEVETPMMHHIAGGAAARPFVTHHNTLDVRLYMRIALELYLKRLLVGGMERVYEIGRVFRNEGIDTSHNPEFTMLELYEAYSDYHGMMELTENMFAHVAKAVNGTTEVTFGEKTYDLTPPFERRTYDELFEEQVGAKRSDKDAVLARAKELDIDAGLPYPVLANDVFEAVVETKLEGPVFVIDYPVEICPLTKASGTKPGIAERFELFIGCMEYANAFTELNDPAEQRKRFDEQLEKCGAEGVEKKMDEDFIRALEFGMPPAGGLGVGIDRLVMLITGRTSIRDVVLFPQLRPEETGV